LRCKISTLQESVFKRSCGTRASGPERFPYPGCELGQGSPFRSLREFVERNQKIPWPVSIELIDAADEEAVRRYACLDLDLTSRKAEIPRGASRTLPSRNCGLEVEACFHECLKEEQLTEQALLLFKGKTVRISSEKALPNAQSIRNRTSHIQVMVYTRHSSSYVVREKAE